MSSRAVDTARVPDPDLRPDGGLVDHLRAVASITRLLLRCNDEEVACRAAVELARERLGLERCGILLERDGWLHGTFGTDDAGRTTDERGVLVAVDEGWDEQFRGMGGRRWLEYHRLRVFWRDGLPHSAGEGWVTVTPILGSSGRMGILSNDAALTGRPLDPLVQEAVAVLCATLGSLLERLRADAALTQGEAKLRVIADQMPAVLWTTDTELRLTALHGACLPDFDLQPARHLGKTLYELFETSSEEHRPLASHLRALRGESVEYEGEFRGRTYAVRVEPLRGSQGQVTGTVRLALDITAQKQADAALREAEERLRFALECSRAGAWEWSDSGETVIWSDGFYHLHGLAPGEIPASRESWLSLVHPDDRQAVAAWYEQALARREEQIHLEFRIRHRELGVRWVVDYGRIEYDPQGEPRRAGGIYLDITAQRALQEQLQHSQRLEALGTLAGGVAHDFNNMLGVINGSCHLLTQQMDAIDPRRVHVEQIRHAGEHAARLTGRLLAYGRRQMLTPRVFPPGDVVRGLSRLLTRVLGEDIRVETDLRDPLWEVRADPAQVEQVLLNLAVNARDAMPTGGKLSILAENIRCTAPLGHGPDVAPPGEYVRLTVQDTGCGIPPDVLARVFEPFFTTKEAGKGTGLGLSVVYGILKQSGGHVEVESAPGVGSVFRAYLPRATEAAPPRPAPQAPPPRGFETLLLAEDEPLLRGLLRALLERQGYRVLEASGAAEALRVAAGWPEPLHLLITDVVMPGESGSTLAAQLRRERPELRVLFITGYTDDTVIRHGLGQGAANLLTKPFTPDELAARVRQLLDAEPGSEQ